MRKTVAKAINKVAAALGKKSRDLKEQWHKTPRPIRYDLRMALLKKADGK